MKCPHVQAPAALLLDKALSATAKLTWLAMHLSPPLRETSMTRLMALTGLSPKTVRAALAQVSDSGPYTGPTVPMPERLLTDDKITTRAKLFYGILQLVPDPGRFTYAALSQLAGTSLNTTKGAVWELVRAGWLQCDQEDPWWPVEFRLVDPGVTRGEEALTLAVRRLERLRYSGEAFMREYLSLLIDSGQFSDDARPGFLINPMTQERLEFDRYYPPKVAFEYQGPQHFGPTKRFSAEESLRLQVRDLIKLGICSRLGITLVEVTAQDLTFKAMQHKAEQVGHLLPLRDLTGHQRLIAYLDSATQPYRAKAARGLWE